MIFGFIASLVISYVLGEFLNKVYFLEFAQSTQNITGWWSFFSIAFGSLLYVIMVFIIIRKCFSLIFQIPDQLLTWFGGQGQSLGNFAGDFSSGIDTGTKVAGGASAYLGAATNQGSKIAGRAVYGSLHGVKSGIKGAAEGFKDGENGGISGALAGAAKGFASGAKEGSSIGANRFANKNNSYSELNKRLAAKQENDSNAENPAATPSGGNTATPNNPEPQEKE